MQRLVYSPKAYVFVESTSLGGKILNLSDYVVSGQINRVVNAVSTATVTLRNPQKIWTGGNNNTNDPTFSPMDKITIFLERVPQTPIQVFTGFLDQAPLYQMYPGVVTLEASCTIKRLLYTYWDPALPFVYEFLAQYGWISDGNGNLTNYTAIAQGSDTLSSYESQAAQDVANANGHIQLQIPVIPANGSSGQVYLDYGKTTSYGSKTNTVTWTDFNFGVTAPLVLNLTGLDFNTTYHYRTETKLSGSPSFIPGNDQTTNTNGASIPPAFQLTDSSISNVLYAVLEQICGWSDDSIFIEQLPSGLVQQLLVLYKNLAENESVTMQQLSNFLSSVIGTGGMGSATSQASASNSGAAGQAIPNNFAGIVAAMAPIAVKNNLPPLFVLNTSYSETGWNPNTITTETGGALGWFQFQFNGASTDTPYPNGQSYTQEQAANINIATQAFCTAALFLEDQFTSPGSVPPQSQWEAWATAVQGSTGYPNWDANLAYITPIYQAWLNKNPSAASAGGQSAFGPSISAANNSPFANSSTTVAATNKGGSTSDTAAHSTSGYSLPLSDMPSQFNTQDSSFGGIDQGVIILTGKLNDPVYSIAPGTFYVSDDGGPSIGKKGNGNQYGTAYPVIDVSDGPWKGRTIFYGYVFANDQLTPGKAYPAGTVIGHIAFKGNNQNSGGGMVDIGFYTGDHNTAPNSWVQGEPATPDAETMLVNMRQLIAGDAVTPSSPQAATGIANSQNTPATTADVESLSVSAAFNTIFNFPSIENTETALLLTGDKSYMNDQSILPFIQQLAQGSLRSFQSMPNGNLFCFFPDYFGGWSQRTPYWAIDDIEILDGNITLNDQALATHVFVSGDTIVPNAGTVSPFDQLASTGVVTLTNAGISNFIKRGSPINDSSNKTVGTAAGSILGDDTQILSTPKDILNFLQRYGVRPLVQDMPLIHSHYFELFMAYQLFQLMWARQYLSAFTFTFMPELYPGGIVAFPNHGIAMYIDSVQHTFDYTDGFTTTANLMAPAALSDTDGIPFTSGLAVQGSLTSSNPGGTS